MAEDAQEMRSLALTPTWSVATVLTIFVAVSVLVERSIHRLSSWLQKTNRKPLLAAVEKMKEELMLLGFISLLLTATSSMISNICIPSKFYDSKFAPCSRSEIDKEQENNSSRDRKLLMASVLPHLFRRMLNELNQNTCKKIHSWRVWEDEAHMDRHDALTEITREQTLRRQSTFVKFHTSNPWVRNSFLVWVVDMFLPAIWAFSGSCRLPYTPEGLHHEPQSHTKIRFSCLYDSLNGRRIPKDCWCEWPTVGIRCCFHAV